MKKNIVTIIVIAVLLTGLMGCDAILEVFYPEFGEDGGGSGGNTIEIIVYLPDEQSSWDSPVVAEMWWSWSDAEVMNPYRTNWAEWDDAAGKPVVRFRFDVPDGEYQISVFQDRNQNGWIDSDEPSSMAIMTYSDTWGDWTEQNIRFPNIMQWSWVSIDIDFSTMTSRAAEVATFWTDFRVINNQSTPSAALELNAPEGKNIESYNINLYDDWGSLAWGGFNTEPVNNSYWSGNLNWSSDINQDQLLSSAGRWKFDVEVWYDDETYSYRSYPVMVVNGPTEIQSSTWYIASIESWGLEYDPTFISWESTYDVILYVDGCPYVFPGAMSGGGLYFDRYSVPKSSNSALDDIEFIYWGSSAPSSSYIEVIIDMDGDGSGSIGDWYTLLPVGLDDYTSWDENNKRYTSFYIEPRSFISYPY